ncbi:metallohydrolase [Candidatus Nanopelagicus limnes]|uniref:Metallohydrolase n=1 Tax=Candidatus Nanopelagicus limnae TaxID=1884634 RepID=A0A249JXS5_9ACTN|nr:MBL fold metallo-hydrolase [Candidatus Nanopelagicus limnes]ASY09320.1 metallohydrolase [Candidatus Nanopelagicus limnes]
MLIDRVIAPYFETNCWILAVGTGNECIIVDPGMAKPNLVNEIEQKVSELKLKPVAVFITHGHLDHTFSVLPLTKQVPMRTFVTGDDRFLLTDPMGALDRGGVSEQFLKAFGVEKFKEPDEIVELEDFSTFEVAGMKITSIFAPGHTKGSVIFTVDDKQLISGDVLFAGSIGRTDLPTGSASQMRKTLRDRILTLPDSLNVLPGHGGQTTIGTERVRNPYLQDDFLDQNGR